MIGREKELHFLEEQYAGKSKKIIVLYGRKGIGKTELLRILSKNKSSIYYMARECSEKEQLLFMKQEWEEAKIELPPEDELSFEVLLKQALLTASLFIVDEFPSILKNSTTFLAAFFDVWEHLPKDKQPMVILSSSSINWIENDMVSVLRERALSISAFLKIKELSFSEVVARFPNYSVEECIKVYAILGGVPSYLAFWNDKRSIKENVLSLFLHKDGRFYHEAENFLKSELRELALYNTILSCLAMDKIKLNDIYERTGFSRAKISVYIKNLIELDVVEKVFSYDTEGRENTKKGLYRIKDHMVHFWYRFLFPNLSLLESRGLVTVYEEKIEPVLEAYTSLYFPVICQEYLTLMSEYQKLNFKIERMGTWFGKDGTIDFIGSHEKKGYFVGACKWDKEAYQESDFEQLLFLIKQAKIEPDHYFIFSKAGFTSQMGIMGTGMDNLTLIDMDDL